MLREVCWQGPGLRPQVELNESVKKKRDVDLPDVARPSATIQLRR